jgi:hypothetical protein
MKCKTCGDQNKLRRMFGLLEKIDNTDGIGITCLDCAAIITNEKVNKKFFHKYKKIDGDSNGKENS